MVNLRIDNLGDVLVLRCSGRIAAEDGDALRHALVGQPNARIVVLDLEEIGAIDAAGLGVLASLRTLADESNTQLKLMNVMPRVDEVLELTSLKSAFEVCSGSDMLDLLCRAIRQSRMAAAGKPSSNPPLAVDAGSQMELPEASAHSLTATV